MKSYVVDSSVVAAAIFQEPLVDCALRVLTGGHALFAPDLIYAEVTNVIRKRYIPGKIDEFEAQVFLADARQLPLEVTPCGELAELAMKLVIATKRSAYDCMYLALAGNTNTVMVSADQRFINGLANTPWAKYIVWLGDL